MSITDGRKWRPQNAVLQICDIKLIQEVVFIMYYGLVNDQVKYFDLCAFSSLGRRGVLFISCSWLCGLFTVLHYSGFILEIECFPCIEINAKQHNENGLLKGCTIHTACWWMRQDVFCDACWKIISLTLTFLETAFASKENESWYKWVHGIKYHVLNVSKCVIPVTSWKSIAMRKGIEYVTQLSPSG